MKIKWELARVWIWKATCKLAVLALGLVAIMLVGAWAEGKLPFLVAALAVLGAMTLGAAALLEAEKAERYIRLYMEWQRRAEICRAENARRAYYNRRETAEWWAREAARNE